MATSWTWRNFSKGTVSGSHNTVVTTLNVTTGHGARFGSSWPMVAVIWRSSAFPDPADAFHDSPSKAEIVEITGRTSDALTIVRARESTVGLDMTDTGQTFKIMGTHSALQIGNQTLWENVQSHGAVGDGATDDATAVLAAIDAAADGGTIYFPSGDYLLTTWPTAGKQIGTGKSLRFIGEEESTITGSASKDFLDVRDSIVVDSLRFKTWDSVFNLNGNAATVERVEIQNCRSDTVDQFLEWSVTGAAGKFELIRIANCRLKSSTGIVIDIASDLTPAGIFDHVWIQDNVIDGGDRGIQIGTNVTDPDSGLAVNWRRITITGNQIWNIDALSGAVNGVGIIVYGEDVNISNNIIDDVDGGTSENWGIYTKATRNVISNNNITNIKDTAGTSPARAISLKGVDLARTQEGWPAPYDSVSGGPWGFNSVAIGNFCDMKGATNKATGLRIEMDDCLVMHNVFDNCGDSGITTVGDTVNVKRILISHNKILNGDSDSVGIRVQSPGSNWIIDGNVIENHFKGIEIVPTSSRTDSAFITSDGSFDFGGIQITNNNIKAGANGATNGLGIRFNHASANLAGDLRDILVRGNFIQDFSSGTAAAITFVSSTGPYTDVQILGNMYRNCRDISDGNRISFGTTPTNLLQDEQNGDTLRMRHSLNLRNGEWNGAHLVIGSGANEFHLWQDGTDVRLKKGVPASAADGVPIT